MSRTKKKPYPFSETDSTNPVVIMALVPTANKK
jgi:hypothetical protein